ncbi:acyl-CoA dehydrogenase family protein [Sediminicoccus rosea]|uniref:Acyl-CoA dehydrogenase family protein n=1 Tax=Sediminicoccus rosea TaxID=1225128 RepID=A0ABZ0PCK2_9PROT|nr:acyl-CoA dehydrogenase family protein [Sediminicoccus rosea]WPB83296.1 acyl-CoA dehydrogenase family protein [Sediminicoccus rosea]
MSEMRDIILEQVERLLADQAGVALLRRVEAGEWPAGLWAEMVELGLPLALVPEAASGVGLGWGDAAAVWQVLGRFGAPAPLAEAMLANALLAAAGLEPQIGFISLGTRATPFGRFALHVVTEEGPGRIALRPRDSYFPSGNLAREPRDMVEPGAALLEGLLPNGWGTRATRLGLALVRAAQISGAARQALTLAVDWANTRVQFGRAIGKFQAVQQSLAMVAGDVAALDVAVASAARAVDAHGLDGAAFEIGCAKIIAGETAESVAAKVHQVFAAIGITEDHELHHLTRRLWAWRDEAGSAVTWSSEIGRAVLARGGANLWPDITARDAAGAQA